MKLPDTYSFLELRLSKEDFGAYKCDKPDARRDKLKKDSYKYKVRVYGHGEDAILAIRMSNKEGKEYIELQCWDSDTVRNIKDKLEHRLRIPCKYWALTGDGLMLPPGLLAWMPQYLGVPIINLVIVPAALLQTFEAQKRHVWDHVPPQLILSPDSAVPREMAETLYHIIDARPSLSWEPYVAQRSLAEDRLRRLLDSCKGQPLDPMIEQVRLGRHRVIDHPKERILTNGVIPLRVKIEQVPRPITVKMQTRIYSQTRPAAIDLYWDYYNHNRTRNERVEFNCCLYYRLYDPLTSSTLDLIDVGDPKKEPRAGVNGWDYIFKLAATDPNSKVWRSINERNWGLEPSELTRIHRLLWGTGALAKEVSKLDTVKLLFAAVGVFLGVATEHDDEKCPGTEFKDCLSDDKDVLDPGEIGVIYWDFEQCIHWLCDNIRTTVLVSDCLPSSKDVKAP